jgi:hypothetical protein
MGAQHALDFDRGDVLAAGNDDVLGAVLDLQVAVGMHHAEVAGPEPAIGNRLAGGNLVLVVAEHHIVAAQRDFTERLPVGGHVPAVRVDHAQLLRDHVAHALARLDPRLLADRKFAPFAAPLADHRGAEGLREAVKMRDVHAELRHALQDRRRRRGAPGCHPHRATELPRGRMPREHHEQRRRAVEVGDVRFAQEVPDQPRLELAQAEMDRPGGGRAPGKAPAVAMEHRQRPQESAVAIEPRLQRHRQRLQVRAAMVVHDASRSSGGAAGVVDREQAALVGYRALPGTGVAKQTLVGVVGAAGAHQPQSAAHLDLDVPGDVLELVVVDQDLRAAVRDDEGEIAGGEPHVERDQHRARERHAVVRLEQHVGIGREHGDARALGNAHAAQRAGEPQAAIEELRVGEAALAVDHRSAVCENLA